MSEQDNLIGCHPKSPHVYGDWWTCVDMPVTETKKHRSLEEKKEAREAAVDQIAKWLVEYHLTEIKREAIEKTKAILDKHQLSEYIDNILVLPTVDTTRKGNLGEVLLIEYIKASKGYTPFIYKLHYNPNVNQSMKGDDVLLFDEAHLENEVVYGESKFRKEPSKQVLSEMVGNLEGAKKLPASIGFVANILSLEGRKELAASLMDIHMKLIAGVVPLTNVGFLFSSMSATPSKDVKQVVENNLTTSNPRLVVISVGVDNPQEIVDEAFAKADAILKA